MADPRSEIVTRIRERLVTVPGLWPVKPHGIESTIAPGTSYLAETFAGGPETDAAAPDPITHKRWRDATENYQLMLNTAPDTDIRVIRDQGSAIARAFLDATMTLTDGTAIWFTQYRLTDRGTDGGWQKTVLVLTYRYIYNA